MKNKRIPVFAIIIVTALFLLLFNTIHSNHSTLSDRIISYYENSENAQNIPNESFELNISDFTDFEWEYVMIYRNPTTEKEISEAGGIDYEGDTDLTSGMIFINDNKVVYEEVFETDFESPDKFVIYPHQDINADSKINKFANDNAVFIGKVIEYNGDKKYQFYPKTDK